MRLLLMSLAQCSQNTIGHQKLASYLKACFGKSFRWTYEWNGQFKGNCTNVSMFFWYNILGVRKHSKNGFWSKTHIHSHTHSASLILYIEKHLTIILKCVYLSLVFCYCRRFVESNMNWWHCEIWCVAHTLFALKR